MKVNKELMEKWPWAKKYWKERAKAIAEIIPPEATILDIGGGVSFLKRLKPRNKYASIDIEKWTDITIQADFNKGEFPDIGLFDVIVCQGIIEYIDDKEKFLNEIKKYGRRMIITYATGMEEEGNWKGQMTFDEFDKLLDKAGWIKMTERMFGEKQKIICCVKI